MLVLGAEGAIAGLVVVYGTRALEWYVDDPVGAIAVHGLAGAWGTIAAGLFNSAGFSLSQVGVQIVGVAAAFLWTFPVSYLVCSLVDAAIGIRLNGEKEAIGLDRLEHDVEAYPEFSTGTDGQTNSAGSAEEAEPVAR